MLAGNGRRVALAGGTSRGLQDLPVVKLRRQARISHYQHDLYACLPQDLEHSLRRLLGVQDQAWRTNSLRREYCRDQIDAAAATDGYRNIDPRSRFGQPARQRPKPICKPAVTDRLCIFDDRHPVGCFTAPAFDSLAYKIETRVLVWFHIAPVLIVGSLTFRSLASAHDRRQYLATIDFQLTPSVTTH